MYGAMVLTRYNFGKHSCQVQFCATNVPSNREVWAPSSPLKVAGLMSKTGVVRFWKEEKGFGFICRELIQNTSMLSFFLTTSFPHLINQKSERPRWSWRRYILPHIRIAWLQGFGQRKKGALWAEIRQHPAKVARSERLRRGRWRRMRRLWPWWPPWWLGNSCWVLASSMVKVVRSISLAMNASSILSKFYRASYQGMDHGLPTLMMQQVGWQMW